MALTHMILRLTFPIVIELNPHGLAKRQVGYNNNKSDLFTIISN